MAQPAHLRSVLLVVSGVVVGIGVMQWMRPADSVTPGSQGSSKDTPAPQNTVAAGPVAVEGDPMSVLSGAISNPDRDGRGETLRALAARLVGEDVKKALALAAKIPDASDRLEFLRAVFANWAAKDPKAAMEYAKANFPAGIEQAEAFVAAVEKWGGSNPREAWLWVEANLSGPIKKQAATSLVQGWARRDPEGAAAWFVSTGATSQGMLDALVTTWTGLDAKAAAAWAETLSHPGNKETARVLIAGEWVRQSPAEAAAYFTPMMTGKAAIDLGSALVNSWGAADPSAAADWVRKLPAGDARTNAAGTLATVWAASDIQAAVKWSETIDDAEMRSGVIDQLGTTWGAIEPQKALDWITTLPDGEAKTEATKGALGSWAATRPQDMETWLAAQPPGPLADEGRMNLAAVYADSSQPDSMRIALAISDPAKRGDAASKFFGHWRKVNDAAAQQWLQSNWAHLPADVQKRLGSEQKRNL